MLHNYYCNSESRDHYRANLGLTTAYLKARETGSVAAAARQLFFAYKKKVSLCTPSARRQLLAEHEVLGRCGPKKAPTGGQDTFSTVFWYMQNYSMKESQND